MNAEIMDLLPPTKKGDETVLLEFFLKVTTTKVVHGLKGHPVALASALLVVMMLAHGWHMFKSAQREEQRARDDRKLKETQQLVEQAVQRRLDAARIKAPTEELNCQQNKLKAFQDKLTALEAKLPHRGITPETSNWVEYGINGIYLDVDTSHCNFPEGSMPKYFTSLKGNTNHWTATGATSVYNTAHNSFRIYIYESGITPQKAHECGWRIQWTAFLE